MNLYENYCLIRDTYKLLVEKKLLYQSQQKPEPVLIHQLTKEERLKKIFEEILREEESETQRQISFNTLRRKHKLVKKLLRQGYTPSKSSFILL